MSKILTDLLVKRATDHVSKGFLHLLDFESGDREAITLALIEASSVPQAINKLGLSADYAVDSSLDAAKVQSFQKGLENSFQKTSFVDGYKSELDQFSADLWAYFEKVCQAVEGTRS